MAAAHVQTTANSAGTVGTTLAKAFVGNVVVGNVIVVSCTWQSITATCSVADNLGNAYTPIVSSLATNSTLGSRTQMFWAPVTVAGSCTVTMTTSASNSHRVLIIQEYSGLATSSQPENSNSATGNSTAPAVNVITLSANALVVGWSQSSGTVSAGAGFTGRINQDGNQAEDQIKAVAGSLSVAFTLSPSGQWGVSAASFRLPSAPVALQAGTSQATGSLGLTTSVPWLPPSSVPTPAPVGPLLDFYRFELAHSSDLSRIGELTQARNRSLQLALNRAGAFSCALPLDHELTDSVAEVETCVVITRNGEIIWTGPIWTVNETVSADSATLQIGAVGWLQTLDKRVVRPSWNNNQPITYTDLDAGDIALDLLRRTNADAVATGAPLFLFIGSAESTQLRTRTYQPWAGILAALTELTEIESGFDMAVDPETREMNIYGRVGQDNGVIFELPGDVTQVNRATDSSRIINYMTAYSQIGSQSEADYDSIIRYGLFEEAQSLSDVVNNNILLAFAAGEIFVKSRPLRIITFQPLADSPIRPFSPRVFRDYNIGDTVRLTVRHGRVRMEHQLLRMFSFTVNFPDTGGAAVSDIQTTAGG